MSKPYTALPENQVTPEPRLEKRTRRQFNARLHRRLKMAEVCIDLQKKNVVDDRSREQWDLCMIAVVQERPEGLPLAMACRALGPQPQFGRDPAESILPSEAERAERRSRRACVKGKGDGFVGKG